MSSEQERAVLSAESPLSGFSIEFLNPEAVFERLTGRRGRMQVDLANNWREICDDDYDLFKYLHIAIATDTINAHMCRPHKWKYDQVPYYMMEDMPALKFDEEYLKRQGFVVDGSYLYGGKIKKGPLVLLLNSPDSDRWYDAGGVGKENFYRFHAWSVYMRQPPFDTKQELSANISNFLFFFQHMLKAVYSYHGKELPHNKKLVLLPDLEKKKERQPSMVICSYCASGYIPNENPNCPHCGGHIG